tara:strand:+ start:843 stop:1328 length:486 start_codon:yes stop_codon:yes gene_type:complete
MNNEIQIKDKVIKMEKIRMSNPKMKNYKITKFGDLDMYDYFVLVHEDEDGQYIKADLKKGFPAKVLVRKDNVDQDEYKTKSNFKYETESLSSFRDLQLLGSQKTRSWFDACFWEYDMEDKLVIRLGGYSNDPLISDVRSGKAKGWINHHGKKQTLDQQYQR